MIKNINASKPVIPIAFGCSELYFSYLYVTISSLIKHISKDNFYELNILESCISDKSKKNMFKLIKEYDNVKVNFIDIGYLLKENISYFDSYMKKRNLKSYHDLAAFASIFIPKVFSKYEKILFLDADLIIRADVAELYNTDMQGRAIAGVSDLCLYTAYKYNAENAGMPIQKYFDEILNIDYRKYINMGVFLVDVQKLIKIDSLKKSLELIKAVDILYMDQCIYNKLLKEDMLLLSSEWNHMNVYNLDFINSVEEDEIKRNFLIDGKLKTPKIFHYASKRFKQNMESEMEQAFWAEAKTTPYYKILYNWRVKSFEPKFTTVLFEKLRKFIFNNVSTPDSINIKTFGINLYHKRIKNNREKTSYLKGIVSIYKENEKLVLLKVLGIKFYKK